jgi:hypothetical protein
MGCTLHAYALMTISHIALDVNRVPEFYVHFTLDFLNTASIKFFLTGCL